MNQIRKPAGWQDGGEYWTKSLKYGVHRRCKTCGVESGAGISGGGRLRFLHTSDCATFAERIAVDNAEYIAREAVHQAREAVHQARVQLQALMEALKAADGYARA